MAKIKIIRKVVSIEDFEKSGKLGYDHRWDVYHGFTGMPSTFPFCTKWVLDKKNLTREEVDKYLQNLMLETTDNVTVKTKDYF